MKRLLVLRLSALGDVIHTIPAVLSLKDAADITWVVEEPYRELVEIVAGVKTIPVRMKKWMREPRVATAAIRSMRGVDAAIDFQGLIKSATLGWLSGAKTRIGFDADAIREKPALLFTNRKVPVDISKHIVDQNLQLAAASLGVRWPQPPLLYATEQDHHPPKAVAAATALQNGFAAFPQATGLDAFAGSIVLLPGAGKASKLWPVERFRELAKQIGPKALAVWGPGERELADRIGARVAPPTNLRELAWLLQKAEVVIGGDTGPLHLADALGTKVLGLYGPTDPRRNGPYHQPQHCIDRFPTTKWMESISVEEVMNLLGKVISE
ncbi:MAG: lipopolysaccharide heptosyltransferase I [Acidobacteriota bacterium]|nr:lipopolysaccharide heptosyltransferase I [Acidobacteriota bacterium]